MDAVSPFTNSIFQQPWWLDAVAPNRWSVATVGDADELQARLPYCVHRRYGLRCITQPKLTQTLGPWLATSGRKSTEQLKQEKEWLTQLIDALPKFDYFQQAWHYSVQNWLPFFWRGFECVTRYTYVLENLTDPERLWRGYHDTTQRQIKKARRLVTVRSDLGLERFWQLNQATFARQGRATPYSWELLERLDAGCARHEARRMFFAEDASGRIHSALYLVWDKQSAYYLMSGSVPELRQSGSLSLLMHEAITFASSVTQRFDFEGSMLEAVERFVRNFGATPKPYFVVRGYSKRMAVVQGFRQMFQKAAG